MVKEQTGESGLGLSPVFFPLEKAHCCLPLLGQVGIWFLPYCLFVCFLISDIGRKLTERIPEKLTFLYFLHACVSHSWPSQSSFLETQQQKWAAIIYLSFFFFLSCISSEDFDYYKEPSGQYSTGMARCVSPTLVYSELFSSFLNSVAGRCRQRLRSMLWAWIRTHT